MNQTGYSKTPLSKKLGLKPNHTICLLNAPEGYWKLFDTVPEGIHVLEYPNMEPVDFIHFFCSRMVDLKAHVAKCKSTLKKSGVLWISWPKGSSQMTTDLKRDAIREYVLSTGLVDVKVAAIDEDWSGLKFVHRLKDR